MSATVAAGALVSTISLLVAEPPVTVPVWVAPMVTTSWPVPPTNDWPPAAASVTVMTPDDDAALIAAVPSTSLKSAMKLPAPVKVTVLASAA